MTANSCDILVIGAGAAGLAAAAAIAASGLSVRVLDARERVGGRVWTRTEPGLPVPIELGAEFVHGEPDATFALMRRHGVAAVDTHGPHWTCRKGRLRQRANEFRRVHAALRRNRARLRARDLTFDEYLARIGSAQLPGEARALARALVEGFDAADPARVSARSIVAEWLDGEALDSPQFRPLGGYGALLASLAGALESSSLQLQSAVHAVRWRKGSVSAEGMRLGQAFEVRARAAVVTLPLGVLQAPADAPGAVRFDPPLREKEAPLAQLASGAVLKVILRFGDAFWERANKGACRDAAFFHAPDAPFPTFWTALPVRVPLLVAWSGGPRALRLAAAGRDAIVATALESACSVFGTRALRQSPLESAVLHDWQ